MLKNKNNITTPYVNSFNTSVYAQYTIQIDNRDKTQEKLKNAGIPTAIHYPIPLHKQPVFANYFDCKLPVSELISNKVLSLPMHPYLQDQEIELIVQKLNDL